jgi:tetratricopeptide (TPR) repeat protein
LLRLGRGAEALAAWCRVLEGDPQFAAGYRGAGQALELMGDENGALVSYRHALELDPAYAAAAGSMALLCLHGRRSDEARAFASRALAQAPSEPMAALAAARLDLDDDRFQAVADRLGPLTGRGLLSTPAHEATAHRVLGDALDALGLPQAAFSHFAASAATFRHLHAGTCAGPQPLAGLDLCAAMLEAARTAPPSLWTPAPGAEDGQAAGHVFVVGFPRSGTTLLEQVLASHPAIAALEEAPTLKPAIDAYLDPPTGMAALAAMDEETAERWRRDYWARVRSFGIDVAGKVFVDKQPFYTLWLPLIAKLFPKARVLIVRRDPRDIALSCFRRPFHMTPVTYELMDLERGARLYDAAMRLLDLFIDRAGNPCLAYRHEDLVDDFDGVSRRICDFLGLIWTENLRDFAATARGRAIRTPSARQVIKGLNRRGVGAWRPYAEALAPALPILEPWAERFGYPPISSLRLSQSLAGHPCDARTAPPRDPSHG